MTSRLMVINVGISDGISTLLTNNDHQNHSEFSLQITQQRSPCSLLGPAQALGVEVGRAVSRAVGGLQGAVLRHTTDPDLGLLRVLHHRVERVIAADREDARLLVLGLGEADLVPGLASGRGHHPFQHYGNPTSQYTIREVAVRYFLRNIPYL